MEEGVLLRLVRLFARLAEAAERKVAAQELATLLGAEMVLAFVRDREIGAFVLAPGFTRTLPHQAEWQKFVAECAGVPHLTGHLPSPHTGERLAVTGIGWKGEAALIIGGPGPAPLVELIHVFPLLALTLQTEHLLLVQRAQAGLAHNLAQQSQLLAEGLDNARRAAQHEITERKKADKALTRISEELQQANSELLIARDRALAASRAKDDFLAALSHELRTPLNPVLLVASEAAQNTALPAEIRQDFELIAKNVALEARLIDDLLDLTRITRGKMHFERRPVAVGEILKDTIAMLKADMIGKKISFSCDVPDALPWVLGDPVRLHQVFWNVIQNAVKFTPEGGKISVEIFPSPEPGQLTLEVRDSGIGLTEAECRHIFEAFRQGEHASAGGSHRFGGLGLGLGISKALTELHGGSIRAHSAGRGQGATFVVQLPCLETGAQIQATPLPVPAGNAAPPPVKSEAPATVAAQMPRLLLVEDHASSGDVLALLLRKRGYRVTLAPSAEAALALAATNDFDVLISDLSLPGQSGYQLMNALQKSRPGIIGIALSGYGTENDITRSHAAGFTAHLVKPIHLKKLDALLRKVLPFCHAPAGE